MNDTLAIIGTPVVLAFVKRLNVNHKILLLALASGSTIAGNLSVLRAASNVIIIENAETKSGQTLTFWEFVKIGLPLTILCAFVYWLFLSLV